MKKIFLLLLAVAASLTVWSRQDRQNIIFETDMGNDVDDALAIDMLYKYHAEKRIDLMAVMLNKEGEFPPMYIDLLNTWYGQRRIPIGTSGRTGQSLVAGKNYTQVVVEETDPQGNPLYRRSISDYSKLPTAVELYRKLLAKAKDGSVTIVSVGFSTNLARLLETGADKYSPLSGRELVAKKVSHLVAMVGHFTKANYAEYNVINDIPSCQQVFNEWPTPIYCSGFEIGENIRYPAASITGDFGWTPHHPIVDSYKSYLPKLEDRPTWDLTAVLYAIDPADRFGISKAGRVTITPEGFSLFKPDPTGRHFYLTVNDQQRRQILDYFVKLITRKP